MHVTARAALAALTLAGGLGAGLQPPARASVFLPSAPNAPWGYVWADQANAPVGNSYAPDRLYQYTSLGGENSGVFHNATAVYTVFFARVAAPGGTVLVTAYGSPAWCAVDNWRPLGPNEGVLISCYGPGGVPVDARFDATFTKPASVQGRFGYVWNDRAAAPLHQSYVPNTLLQFNSAHARNTIVRDGTGHYTVTLPHLGAAGGVALVTAYFTPVFCKPRAWAESGTAETIDVRCYDSAGNPANASFAVTFENGTDALATGWGGGYVLAGRPTTTSYVPSDSWNQFGGANRVFHFAPGTYQVDMGYLAVAGGDVQVSATGNGDTRCYTRGWSYFDVTETITVSCATAAGQPADSPFVVSFIRGPAVP